MAVLLPGLGCCVCGPLGGRPSLSSNQRRSSVGIARVFASIGVGSHGVANLVGQRSTWRAEIDSVGVSVGTAGTGRASDSIGAGNRRLESRKSSTRANLHGRTSPYCERVIGSIRRECLNHAIILSERHLKQLTFPTMVRFLTVSGAPPPLRLLAA